MDENFKKLLDFQAEAVEKVLEGYAAYDPSTNLFSSGRGSSIPAGLKGKPKPYLHRVKAVTGAGKTPVLAALASRLKNCVIVWTTPRGAVISQTNEALLGKYASLLPDNKRVLALSDIVKGGSEWHNVLNAEDGCTIITATVASYNQDKDSTSLLIYQGSPSPWDQLCTSVKRDVWVFYDEGHNVTEAQFAKLLELRPKGFVLASASPLPTDLYLLIPGETLEDKEAEFNQARTTAIDTRKVVEQGLLKETITLHDIEAGFEDILKAAVDKRAFLGSLCDDQAIACYVVDRDSTGQGVVHGLAIWEQLVLQGVAPASIAVHLSGAKEAAVAAVKAGKSQYKSLIASYDDKLSPGDLKAAGFRHIIWNLSLQEGWDEPWAYVGYFHGEQRNVSQVIQRIGRLIRNPFRDEAGLPAQPESLLRVVHCYLRTPNDLLKQVVEGLKKEMNTSGLDVFVSRTRSDNDRGAYYSPVLRNKSVERLCLSIDKANLQSKLQRAVLKPAMAEDAYFAQGVLTTVSVNVGGGALHEAPTLLPHGVPATVADIVHSHLELRDPRLVRTVGGLSSTGGWIDPGFWDAPEFAKQVHIASDAYVEFKRRCDDFLGNQLGSLVRIVSDNDEDNPYVVAPIRIINPDGGTSSKDKSYYRVHRFYNSVHGEYNCLNPFELSFAQALDATGLTWARNPARVGYGIPLVRPAGSSTTFYPDFIVWKDGAVLFFETKGRHLWGNFVDEKLKELPTGYSIFGVTEVSDSIEIVMVANGQTFTNVFQTVGLALAEVLA